MKQLKPRVVRDFRGQDYVQTSNVCGNTTYIRNYEVTYQLSHTPSLGVIIQASLRNQFNINIYMKKWYLYTKVVLYIVAVICYVLKDYNQAIFFAITAIYIQQEQMMLED